MLAANEAVASFLSKKQLPFLFRIHEEPDEKKISDFKEFVFNLGYVIKGRKITPKLLQKLLEEVSGKKEEKTVNHLLLRSMKQALYSEKNVGHFGLASERYCHFTSPIRRYPDLVVHRILKKALEEHKHKSKLHLPNLCYLFSQEFHYQPLLYHLNGIPFLLHYVVPGGSIQQDCSN